MLKILVVDDQPELREQLVWAAKGDNRDISAASGKKQAFEFIDEEIFDVIVTDLKMETADSGLEVLKYAKERDPLTQVIVVTYYGKPELSVETIFHGAFDYIERNAPGTNTLKLLKHKINQALEFRQMKLTLAPNK